MLSFGDFIRERAFANLVWVACAYFLSVGPSWAQNSGSGVTRLQETVTLQYTMNPEFENAGFTWFAPPADNCGPVQVTVAPDGSSVSPHTYSLGFFHSAPGPQRLHNPECFSSSDGNSCTEAQDQVKSFKVHRICITPEDVNFLANVWHTAVDENGAPVSNSEGGVDVFTVTMTVVPPTP